MFHVCMIRKFKAQFKINYRFSSVFDVRIIHFDLFTSKFNKPFDFKVKQIKL